MPAAAAAGGSVDRAEQWVSVGGDADPTATAVGEIADAARLPGAAAGDAGGGGDGIQILALFPCDRENIPARRGDDIA